MYAQCINGNTVKVQACGKFISTNILIGQRFLCNARINVEISVVLSLTFHSYFYHNFKFFSLQRLMEVLVQKETLRNLLCLTLNFISENNFQFNFVYGSFTEETHESLSRIVKLLMLSVRPLCLKLFTKLVNFSTAFVWFLIKGITKA